MIPLRSHVTILENSEGYTRYDCPRHVLEILASEQTYERLEEGHPRAGYFLAHELGHCVLHTDQLVRLAEMPPNQQKAFHRGGRSGHKSYEDTEWQANAFASALLMPARGIAALAKSYGQVSVGMVADRFRVSREAAGYRMDLIEKKGKELLS